MKKINYSDTYRHKGLRNKLVQVLILKGILDKKVLKAIAKVPRHFFLDTAFSEQAYMDKALPIDAEQTISQPFTVARQTELLEINPTDKVLEIGTGSGYQSCVLAELGCTIHTVERIEKLYNKASDLLSYFGYPNVTCYLSDGTLGLKEESPFDKIIFTAGAENLPEELLSQLAIGGYLLIPIGKDIQIMTRYKRISQDQFTKETFGEYRFVPVLTGIQK